MTGELGSQARLCVMGRLLPVRTHRQVEDQDHDVCAGGLGRRVRDLSPDLVDQGQAGAERHPGCNDQHEHHLEAEVDHGLGGERGGP